MKKITNKDVLNIFRGNFKDDKNIEDYRIKIKNVLYEKNQDYIGSYFQEGRSSFFNTTNFTIYLLLIHKDDNIMYPKEFIKFILLIQSMVWDSDIESDYDKKQIIHKLFKKIYLTFKPYQSSYNIQHNHYNYNFHIYCELDYEKLKTYDRSEWIRHIHPIYKDKLPYSDELIHPWNVKISLDVQRINSSNNSDVKLFSIDIIPYVAKLIKEKQLEETKEKILNYDGYTNLGYATYLENDYYYRTNLRRIQYDYGKPSYWDLTLLDWKTNDLIKFYDLYYSSDAMNDSSFLLNLTYWTKKPHSNEDVRVSKNGFIFAFIFQNKYHLSIPINQLNLRFMDFELQNYLDKNEQLKKLHLNYIYKIIRLVFTHLLIMMFDDKEFISNNKFLGQEFEFVYKENEYRTILEHITSRDYYKRLKTFFTDKKNSVGDITYKYIFNLHIKRYPFGYLSLYIAVYDPNSENNNVPTEYNCYCVFYLKDNFNTINRFYDYHAMEKLRRRKEHEYVYRPNRDSELVFKSV